MALRLISTAFIRSLKHYLEFKQNFTLITEIDERRRKTNRKIQRKKFLEMLGENPGMHSLFQVPKRLYTYLEQGL